MVWKAEDPQGNESAKIKWELVPYTVGRGLDIGAGPYKPFAHFLSVDDMNHAQQFGWQYRPDIVSDGGDLSMFASQSMDFVYSSHTLEHIEDYQAALKEWWRLIKPGGYLCLYLPHKHFYPNIGQEGANPDHKHDFLPADIIEVVPDGFDLVENQERNEGTEYSFFQVFKKTQGKGRDESWKIKPEKTCAIIRYGAFGDVMQASSILPWLKEQGYHVTFFTVPRGYDVIRHDPHIDKFVVQDPDQVPNQDLGDYWKYLKAKYDKFINLSESTEGSLLVIPGRIAHTWSKEARHKMLNINYTEMVHAIAEVPMPGRQKFYATIDEKAWVRKQKDRVGKCILWTLSGSSVHKIWPNMDAVVARILMHTDYSIIFCGDETSKLLEGPWTEEPRIFCRSGEWTIRQTMAMAQICEMVIGPETGVLNAVALDDCWKVVTLSHSSEENLTKHWKNAIALAPKDTPCYPCHMMHYNFDFCNRDEEMGTAKCQADITADQMWEAIAPIFHDRKAA